MGKIRKPCNIELKKAGLEDCKLCKTKMGDLQMGSSLVLVSENSGGLHNEIRSTLTPRDLFWVPTSQ